MIWTKYVFIVFFPARSLSAIFHFSESSQLCDQRWRICFGNNHIQLFENWHWGNVWKILFTTYTTGRNGENVQGLVWLVFRLWVSKPLIHSGGMSINIVGQRFLLLINVRDIIHMYKHSLSPLSFPAHFPQLSHITSLLSLGQAFLFPAICSFFLVWLTSRMCCRSSLPFFAQCGWQEFIPFKTWLETKMPFLTILFRVLFSHLDRASVSKAWCFEPCALCLLSESVPWKAELGSLFVLCP